MITESEVRRLRDSVYGRPCSDENWNACRVPGGQHGRGWLHEENVKWLSERAKIKLLDNSKPTP